MSYPGYNAPGSPFNDPPRGARAGGRPQAAIDDEHVAFSQGGPQIYSPPPMSHTSPSYPPSASQHFGSTYSLTESYAGDSDEKGYRPVGVEEEYGTVPHQRGYQTSSPYGAPSSAEGSYGGPGAGQGYGFPSAPGSLSSKGSMAPKRGLTRKQTNAEGFRQRQQQLLGRSKTKKVVLKNGHLITYMLCSFFSRVCLASL